MLSLQISNVCRKIVNICLGNFDILAICDIVSLQVSELVDFIDIVFTGTVFITD